MRRLMTMGGVLLGIATDVGLALAQTTLGPHDGPAKTLLKRAVHSVDWRDQPMENVVQWLEQQGPIRVEVDWSALESHGVTRQTTLSLHVGSVSVGDLLALALEQAGDGLSYQLEGDRIRIGTLDSFRAPLVTRVYDVSDLINAELLTPSRSRPPNNDESPIERAMSSIIETIKANVKPETWDLYGGRGTIFPRYDRKVLIVVNTAAVHGLIGRGYRYSEEVVAGEDRIPEVEVARFGPAPTLGALGFRRRPRRKRNVITPLEGECPQFALCCPGPAVPYPPDRCWRLTLTGMRAGCPVLTYTALDCETLEPAGPSLRFYSDGR